MSDSLHRFVKSWGGVFFFGMLALAFAWQWATIQTLKQSRLQPSNQYGTLKAGDKLPVWSAKLLGGDGAEHPIDLSGKTIVYVWAPSCIWCLRNSDNAKAVEQAGGKFISISTVDYGVKEYADANHITHPVYYGVKNLGITGTPTTLIVQDGVVRQAWFGAWTDKNDNKAQVEKYFGLVLPGLRD